jgi:hypothetical protein
MIIFTNLVKYITFGFAGGITLYPFILILKNMKKDPEIDIIINHEKIHIEQQKELFIIGFYFLYFYFIIINMIKELIKFNFKNSFLESYHKNPFEKEAYFHEKDFNYLNNRLKNNWMFFR